MATKKKRKLSKPKKSVKKKKKVLVEKRSQKKTKESIVDFDVFNDPLGKKPSKPYFVKFVNFYNEFRANLIRAKHNNEFLKNRIVYASGFGPDYTKQQKKSIKTFTVSSLALVAIMLAVSGFVFIQSNQIPQVALIKSQKTTQLTKTPVAGQLDKKVNWMTVLKLKDVEAGQKYLPLPKNAQNVKLTTFNSQKEANKYIRQKQQENKTQTLSMADRQQLAMISEDSANKSRFSSAASLLDAFSKYLLGSLENSIEGVVPAETTVPITDSSTETTAEVLTLITDDSQLINVSQVSEVPQIEEQLVNSESSVSSSSLESSSESSASSEESASSESSESLQSSSEASVAPKIQIQQKVVVVEYTTESPVISEKEVDTGKIVTVSAPDEPKSSLAAAPIVDVLAHTNIPKIYKVGEESKIKIKWKNNGNQNVAFQAFDLNNDGYLDYVEWTVPHLSDQIFEIIFISKAFLLDENQSIIADVYDQAKAQDNNWFTVTNGQYVRFSFGQVLDETKDNTIYARPHFAEGSARQTTEIQVYPVYTDANGNQTEGRVVAQFPDIDHEGTYKILLTKLQTPTDTFDFKIIGSVDLDFIVDPNTCVDTTGLNCAGVTTEGECLSYGAGCTAQYYDSNICACETNSCACGNESMVCSCGDSNNCGCGNDSMSCGCGNGTNTYPCGDSMTCGCGDDTMNCSCGDPSNCPCYPEGDPNNCGESFDQPCETNSCSCGDAGNCACGNETFVCSCGDPNNCYGGDSMSCACGNETFTCPCGDPGNCGCGDDTMNCACYPGGDPSNCSCGSTYNGCSTTGSCSSFTAGSCPTSLGCEVQVAVVSGPALLAHYKMNDTASATEFTMYNMTGVADATAINAIGKVGRDPTNNNSSVNLSFRDGNDVDYYTQMATMTAGDTIRVYGTDGSSNPVDVTTTITSRSEENTYYVWNTGDGNNSFPNLAGGSYTVVVTILNRTVVDSSGNNNNGSAMASANTLTTTGKVSGALNFNGTTDVVNASDTGFPSGASARSIFAWVNTAKTDSFGQEAIAAYGTYSGDSLFAFDIISGGTLHLSTYNHNYDASTNVQDGNWHFVGITFDGTDAKFWVDGVQDGATFQPTVDTTLGGTFAIGYDTGTSYLHFQGAIDDVRIYSKALTQSDITYLYYGGAGTESDLGVNLYSHWKLNETSGTTVADSTTNASGTSTTNTSNITTTGLLNGAFTFGSGAYVEVDDAADNFTLSDGHSLSFWIKTTDANDRPVLATKLEGGIQPGNGWYFKTDGTYVTIGGFDSAEKHLGNFSDLADGTWHLATMAVDSSNIYFYIDDVLKSTTAYTTSVPPATGQHLRFGNHASFPGGYWDGSLDDVRFYNETLTLTKITEIYNSGSGTDAGELPFSDGGSCTLNGECASNFCNSNNVCTDKSNGSDCAVNGDCTSGNCAATSLVAHYLMNDNADSTNVIDNSGNGNDGTATTYTNILNAIGKINGSLDLSGSNYIDTNYVYDFGSTDWSVAGWFYNSANTWVDGLMSNGRTGSDHAIYIASYHVSFNSFLVDLRDTSVTSIQMYSNAPLNESSWHHFVVERNGNTAYLYIDNSLEDTADLTGVTMQNSASSFVIGQDGSSHYFNGTVDDVRIYNYGLSASEIGFLYNAGSGTESGGSICQISSNTAPNAPTLVSPATGSYTTDTTPTLSANYSDSDTGDTGTTSYRVSSGTAQNCLDNANIAASGASSETASNSADTTWTNGSSIGSDGTYYWCAQNNDGTATSSWTSMGSFILDTTAPSISYAYGTPSDSSVQSSTTANVIATTSDANTTHSVVNDWNSSLVGWWRFNTNNDSQSDSSGNGNTATNHGATYTTAGKLGGAYSFNGTIDDYIKIDSSNSLLIGSKDITISFWINPVSFAEQPVVIHHDRDYSIVFNSSGDISYANSGTWNFNNFGYTDIGMTTSTWQHVVLTQSGSSVKIYRNNSVITKTFNARTDVSNYPLYLGVYSDDSGGTGYYSPFNGSLDDVQIYNRALSADEVASLYDASANQYSHSFTNLASGSYTFKTYAQDLAGNVALGGTRTFTVDTTAPNTATLLGWSQTSPYNSVSVTASWTKSNSADLANQKIQFYADGACVTTSGSLIDLSSNTSQTRAFTGSDQTTYTYKITSIDTAGNETISACSSDMDVVLNTAPTLTSVAPSTNPIKGGNTIIITPTGQGDAESNTLNFYCNETGSPTSADTLCGEGNASYTSPYANMRCNYNVSGDATKTVYCRTYDGTAYSSEKTMAYVVDSTAPTTTASAGAYVFEQVSTENVTLTLSCVDCQTISYCQDTTDTCTPTTTYSSPLIISVDGTTYVRYLSTDAVGNAETAGSKKIIINKQATETVGAGGGSIYIPTTNSTETPPTTTTPGIVDQIVQQVTNVIETITNPSVGSEQTSYPPISESVTEKAPVALQGWDVMEVKPLSEFVLTPINSDVGSVADKIPQFNDALTALGIDANNLNDVQKLGNTELYLPGLTKIALTPAEILATNKFAEVQGIPLAEMSPEALSKIPTDIVFARSGGELIDYSTSISVDSSGQVQQKVKTVASQAMDLVVKPGKPAVSVIGYLTLKQVAVGKEKTSILGYMTKYFTASLVDSIEKTQAPAPSGNALLVNKFDYVEVSPGIFRASISTPSTEGQYDISTIIQYKDLNLAPKETKMTVVVNPEGYVYSQMKNGRLRIENASVSLYWLNVQTGNYEIWPADKFLQRNPVLTDNTGKYSFLVSEGTYKIKVEASGYFPYESKSFEMKGEIAVSTDVELFQKISWLDWFSWQSIITALLLILVGYNIWQHEKFKSMIKGRQKIKK